MSEEIKDPSFEVSKFEAMTLAELMYMYFKTPDNLKKLTSNKMFYMGESEEGDKEYFVSVFLAGFEQYSTHLLFDPKNILDIKVAHILPNESYTQDDVVVRQLTEEQAMMICGMIGMDLLTDYITNCVSSD